MTKKKAMLPGASASAGDQRASLNAATVQCFLDHLAATCHVQGAAGAAGASTSAFYKLRRGDPAFAEAWRAAVQAGYERLEEALLARAIEELGPYAVDPGAVAVELVDGGGAAAGGEEADGEEAGAAGGGRSPPRRGRGGLSTSAGLAGRVARIDVQLALTLLNRRAAIEAKGRERHVRRRPTAEEVERALTAKLDGLARRLGAPER